MVDERVLNFRKQSVYAEPDSEGTKKKKQLLIFYCYHGNIWYVYMTLW